MKPKAIWLTTIGLSSVALISAVPLGQAASQFWKPEVAHAAKVTAHLVKSRAFNPIGLARRSRLTNPTGQSGQPSRTTSSVLMRYATSQPLAFALPTTLKQPLAALSLVTSAQINTWVSNTSTKPTLDQLLIAGRQLDLQNRQNTLEKAAQTEN